MPKNIHLQDKQMFCPYCANKVVFKRHKSRGVKVCPICGISERDYYVKKINNIKE